MKVKKVNYDNHFESGCETCDYGSSYVNDIEIIFGDGTYIHIKVAQMYAYKFSESDFINILGMSNDLNDMWSNLFTRLEEKCWHGDVNDNVIMTVNGEEVDVIRSCETKRLICIEGDKNEKDFERNC